MGFSGADAIRQQIATSRLPDIDQTSIESAQKAAKEAAARTAETVADLKFTMEEATNPLATAFKSSRTTLKDSKTRLKKAEKQRGEKKIVGPKDLKDSASKFQQRNPELKASILVLLADRAKNAKDAEELLDILHQFYPDPALKEEALRFLLENAVGDFKKLVEEALEQHEKQFGREIAAGKNIQAEVLKYAEKTTGTPSTLRGLYQDITGTPREPLDLFLELADRYSYKDLRKVLAFLFHSLGADLKSKGPSIPKGLLHTLFSETRSLQAILGLYQFFRSRMKLISFLFKREGLNVPEKLNFENLAKEFVNLLKERYPSGDKAMQMMKRLTVDDWILAKIIVLSQFRDGVREISLDKFYRSLQHRDDLYTALLDALEELEEQLEEEEGEEEDEGIQNKQE